VDGGPVDQDVPHCKLDQRIISLIPMTDMTRLQGSYVPNMDFIIVEYDIIGSIFCCRALDSVQAGSQVAVLARTSGSLFYFMDYGWVPENYPVCSEMYCLELGISSSDPLYERKKHILETKFKTRIPMLSYMLFRIKPELFNMDIETNSNRLAFDGVFSFVRIIQANEGSFSYLGRCYSANFH